MPPDTKPLRHHKQNGKGTAKLQQTIDALLSLPLTCLALFCLSATEKVACNDMCKCDGTNEVDLGVCSSSVVSSSASNTLQDIGIKKEETKDKRQIERRDIGNMSKGWRRDYRELSFLRRRSNVLMEKETIL